VVVSARGNATDELVILLKKAQANISFQADFEQFKKYQLEGVKENIFEEEFSVLQKLLEGVSLLGDYSDKIKDQVIAYGEILSAKYVAYVLNENSIKAQFSNGYKFWKCTTN
jgi:aspartokinase/homoserine dehydrogenase 1